MHDIQHILSTLPFAPVNVSAPYAEAVRLASSMAEMSLEGVYLLTFPELHVIFLNTRLSAMLGNAELPLSNQPSDALLHSMHPHDIPRLTAALQPCLTASDTDVITATFRLHHAEGHWQRIEVRHRVFQRDREGSPVLLLGMAADITHRGQAEQAALDRRYILENARCLLWSANVFETDHPLYLHWETHYPALEAAQRFLPLPRHENGYAVAFYEARFEEDRQRCNILSAKSIRAGQSYEQEFRVRTVDGDVRWMHEALQVETIEVGKQWRVVGVCTDITERKRMEQALLESEARFHSLVEELPLLVWMLDAEGNHLFVNRTWREFTGRTLEETRKDGWQQLIHPDELPAFREAFQKFLQRRSPHQTEFLFAHHSGEYRPILNTAVPRFYPDGTFIGFVGASIDLTEQKALQAQLRESQKLESIGRLAGGIAHDYNNLLTAILGYTELAQSSLPGDSEVRSFLDNVKLAADRSAELTRQLLMYARRQMVEFTSVDINAVILGIFPLLQRTIGENYDLTAILTEEAWCTRSNASQLEQVLTNLVVNARDSMPEGGRILIETQCVSLDAAYAKQHLGVAPGEYVMFSVSDNGVGMTAEVRERVFEPFFTTKEVGRGTGLGLATCYGIVKQSKGNIWVYSEPGKGTTFKVYLPRIYDAAPTPPAVSDDQPEGTETILLVDDEPMVRDIAARSLRARGYCVLEAGNGMDALEVQRKLQGTVDLLVSDVVMPQMGGRELAARLQEMYPAMRVLYMSGYTENVVLQQGILERDIPLITKPFTAADLLQKVKDALQSPTTPPCDDIRQQ